MLLNLLENHANGSCELTPTRIKAIEILLKKALPDLTATEITSISQPIHYYAELPRKDSTAESWSRRVGPRGTGAPDDHEKPQKTAESHMGKPH